MWITKLSYEYIVSDKSFPLLKTSKTLQRVNNDIRIFVRYELTVTSLGVVIYLNDFRTKKVHDRVGLLFVIT